MAAEQPLRVLLVEDDRGDYLLTREKLSDAGEYELEWAATFEAGLEAVQRDSFAAILLDYRLGGRDGIAFLKEAHALGYHAPVILLTGQHNRELDLEAMRAGAADFLVKSEITASLLERSLRYAIRQSRAEEVLQLRERALASISEGILITDPHQPDNPIMYVNPAFERMTGYSAEEVIGINCRFLQGPKTDPEAVKQLATSIRAQRATGAELLNYRKDGTTFWNQLSISPVRGDRGRVLHFVGVQKDVTERREAALEIQHRLEVEHTLSEVSRRLTTSGTVDIDGMLEMLGAVASVQRAYFFLLREDGKIVDNTHEWCAPGVRSRMEKRQGLDALLYPWVNGRLKHGETVAIPDVRKVTGEAAAERAGWEQQEIRALLVVPVQSPAGQTLGFMRFDDTQSARAWSRHDAQALRVAGDILGSMLARQRAEERLRQSEQRYRGVVELTPDAVLMHCEGEIVFVNPAAVQLLRAENIEQLIGMSVFDIVPPEDRELVGKRIALVATLGSDPMQEERLLLLDGETIPVVISAAATTHDGKPAVQAIIHDLTEHRRAAAALQQREEQLRQAQKMEAVGRLAGGIAHDFNNLLTAIKGNTEIVLMDIAEDSPLREDLLSVQHAANRAAALTRQLLAFSRRQVLKPDTIHLNQVVTDLERMLRRLIGEHIEFATELASELHPIHADRGQLEQVLMNLVVNARDAMPEGGRIVVETANAALTEAHAQQFTYPVKTGPYVRLTVTDAGAGMDAETKAQIFEPFFTTKAIGKGTGLGLATVYGIVKQSGGYIWVNSAIGRGTTFDIYLPRSDGDGGASVEATEAATEIGRETVLVVEDEDIVRDVAIKILKRGGYTVLAADGAEGALRIVREHSAPIHLLLTDVVMPGMKGPALAERLRGRRPEMRVVYMSGYAEEAIASHGVMDADSSFIEKPFPPDALLAKVRDALDRAG